MTMLVLWWLGSVVVALFRSRCCRSENMARGDTCAVVYACRCVIDRGQVKEGRDRHTRGHTSVMSPTEGVCIGRCRRGRGKGG